MKLFILLASVVLLSACSSLEGFGELQAQSDATGEALQREFGIKPLISWHYRNGEFTGIEVMFDSKSIPNMSVTELQTHVWTAVSSNFKQTPKQLVVSVRTEPGGT